MFSDPTALLIRAVYLLPAGVLSIVVHEMAHAYAAVARGDTSPRARGRLSPDPRRHIEPLGLVMVLLAGVGFGRPVQLNNSRPMTTASRVIIALAGPVANLVLAVVVSMPLRVITANLGSAQYYHFLPCTLGLSPQDLLVGELFYIYKLNLLLMVFNLLPIPGLDGWDLLSLWLRRANPRLLFQVETNRQGFVIVLIFIFLLFPQILGTVLGVIAAPLAGILGIQVPIICG